MKYYVICTHDKVPFLYVKTARNIAPKEMLREMGCCPNDYVIPITEQCYEEFIFSKYNDWDLKEI